MHIYIFCKYLYTIAQCLTTSTITPKAITKSIQHLAKFNSIAARLNMIIFMLICLVVCFKKMTHL